MGRVLAQEGHVVAFACDGGEFLEVVHGESEMTAPLLAGHLVHFDVHGGADGLPYAEPGWAGGYQVSASCVVMLLSHTSTHIYIRTHTFALVM